MARKSADDRYTDAMRAIIDGTVEGDSDAYRAAATALDDLAGAGELPRGDEFYATVFAALCYDIARMRGDAVRLYRLFGRRYSGQLEYVVGSAAHSRRLVEGLAMLGAGDGGRSLKSALADTDKWLRSQTGPGGKIDHDSPEDYRLFFALLSLLCRFFGALGGPDSDGIARDLAEKAGRFHDDLLRYSPDYNMEFMVSLYLRLVEATYEHSAARLDMGDEIRAALLNSGRYYLEQIEEDAVKAGLLGRASLVCRMPAARDKPVLASLRIGASSDSGGGGRVAYLVASERAVVRAHGGISDILGPDYSPSPHRTDHGDSSGGPDGGGGHFVATYRELGMLLHAGAAEPGDLEAVIVDEACDLDMECGGSGALDLEMLLARLLAAGPACPQIVVLTAHATAEDARRIASWLGAKVVGGGAAGQGRGLGGIDETVYYDGMLHARSHPDEPAPLPRILRRPDAALGAAGLCAWYVRRAEVGGSPVLISIPQHRDAQGFAGEIASRLRRLGEFDLDMGEAAREKADRRHGLARRAAIRAGLDYCGSDPGEALASGVAFDDERMPLAFRKAVMGGVDDGSVSAVVTTSIPCAKAGAPPFRAVILCDPGAGVPAPGDPPPCAPPISAFGYALASEMVGGGGPDRTGKIVAVANSKDEFDAMRLRLWGDAPRVTSALAWYHPMVTHGLATHLARIALESGGRMTTGDMMRRLSLTWFWESSDPASRAALECTIKDILEQMAALRLLERHGGEDGGGSSANYAYTLTDLGARVCRLHLPALQTAGTIRGLEELQESGIVFTASSYFDDLEDAWSDATRVEGSPPQGAAPNGKPGQGTGEGAGGGTGAGFAVAEQSIPYPPPLRHPRTAAESGRGVPASYLLSAKAESVDMARTLLALADLYDGLKPGSNLPEEMCRTAIRYLSDAFEDAGRLSRYCVAVTDRERAAYLMHCLVEDAPTLLAVGRQGAPLPTAQTPGVCRGAMPSSIGIGDRAAARGKRTITWAHPDKARQLIQHSSPPHSLSSQASSAQASGDPRRPRGAGGSAIRHRWSRMYQVALPYRP